MQTNPKKKFSREMFSEPRVDPRFKALTDLVSEEKNGVLIRNHGPSDAWYLFRKIFDLAQKDKRPVTIVCGTLREDFYNFLEGELQGLIKEHIPVRVYLAEEDPKNIDKSENSFAAALCQAAKDNPENYKLGGGVLSGELREIPHVIYAGDDGMAFRLEKDQEEHTAVGSFGPVDSPAGLLVADYFRHRIEDIEKEMRSAT